MSPEVRGLIYVITQAKTQLLWWRAVPSVIGADHLARDMRVGLGQTIDLLMRRLERLDSMTKRDFLSQVFNVEPSRQIVFNSFDTAEAAWSFYASFYNELLETFLCQKSTT